MRLNLFFTAALALINRHKFALLNVELIRGDDLPFVKALSAQRPPLKLFRGFGALKLEDLCHEREDVAIEGATIFTVLTILEKH